VNRKGETGEFMKEEKPKEPGSTSDPVALVPALGGIIGKGGKDSLLKKGAGGSAFSYWALQPQLKTVFIRDDLSF